MLKEHKMRLIMEFGEDEKLPNNLKLEVSFCGHARLDEALEGFKFFLNACEYSRFLIDEINMGDGK